jgi:hypothetical protein
VDPSTSVNDNAFGLSLSHIVVAAANGSGRRYIKPNLSRYTHPVTP